MLRKYGILLSAAMLMLAACGKDEDSQQAQMPPNPYVQPQCAAEQMYDPYRRECVNAQIYTQQTYGQSYKGALEITDWDKYRDFIKQYTQSSPSFCKVLIFNGWKPAFADCYDAFVGFEVLVDLRFAPKIVTGSQVNSILLSGIASNYSLPVNFAFYPKAENSKFELRSNGIVGTRSWNDIIKIRTNSMTFEASTGTIKNDDLTIQIFFNEAEIASGVVSKAY